jgi:predicted phosphoadenosine phosphosulfate sulfurtransferase
MPKRFLPINVFDAAMDRMMTLYGGPYWPVVSFSGGKDSGVCVELAVLAARACGRLPVQVSMRDEEIMFPGTFEYAERLAARGDEIEMHWWVAGQPVVNVYNRAEPYFWVFDQQLRPEQWMRQPPAIAKPLHTKVIQGVVSRATFPQAPEDQEIIAVTGIRASESPNRMMGTFSAGGWMNVHTSGADGARMAKPIYDWKDDDVWLAHQKFGWDYNDAYNVMHRMGIPKTRLRIAPPTLSPGGAAQLQVAARAWPRWFDKLCTRLPGVRNVALFGKRAVEPQRRYGETWQACFQRECVDTAPAWIAERATSVAERLVRAHAKHSSSPFPEIHGCSACGQQSSWRAVALGIYNGDPFDSKGWSYGRIAPVEPEFFRPGAGTWGQGSPTF